MKKYLLGALFVLSIGAYAQNNRVIEPVVNEEATANVGIEVTGKVYEKTQLSLVVDLKSSVSPTGTGFAFEMPHMFSGTNTKVSAQGDYEIYLEKAGKRVPFSAGSNLSIKLVNADGQENATVTNQTLSGTATNVTLNYSIVGGDGPTVANKTIHKGGVLVQATGATNTTAGTYSDTSVQLKVALSGQTDLLP